MRPGDVTDENFREAVRDARTPEQSGSRLIGSRQDKRNARLRTFYMTSICLSCARSGTRMGCAKCQALQPVPMYSIVEEIVEAAGREWRSRQETQAALRSEVADSHQKYLEGRNKRRRDQRARRPDDLGREI